MGVFVFDCNRPKRPMDHGEESQLPAERISTVVVFVPNMRLINPQINNRVSFSLLFV